MIEKELTFKTITMPVECTFDGEPTTAELVVNLAAAQFNQWTKESPRQILSVTQPDVHTVVVRFLEGDGQNA